MRQDIRSAAGRRVIPWQGRLITLAAIWGMSFLLVKVGDEGLAPLQVALGRMLFGTATVVFVLRLRRESLPRGRALWWHLTVAGLLFNALPFALYAYGETRTTSVLAGILNATTPLFTLVVAMLVLPEERPTRQRTTGLLIGFVGVLVVMGIWQGVGGHSLIGNLACLGAALCYGLGFPYTRRYLSGRRESITALTTGQLLCGTAELALVTPFLTTLPSTLPVKAIIGVLILGVAGTGLAYLLNYSLIRDAGATSASMVTYLIPLFSTVAGVLILGEPLSPWEPIGAVVVIFGIAVSQGQLRGSLRSTFTIKREGRGRSTDRMVPTKGDGRNGERHRDDDVAAAAGSAADSD